MRANEVIKLVESTSDAAFAVNAEGLLTAWNHAAEQLFGVPATEACGQKCGHILFGSDECGGVCSDNCLVQQAAWKHRPLHNFDLQVETKAGRQWCNISVLMAEVEHSFAPFTIHLVRPIDLIKRLEILINEFVQHNVVHQVTNNAQLSPREIEVLRLVGEGQSTGNIALQLGISQATVNNHLQKIMHKLNVHSRLAAIRRAEHAGLI